MKADRIKTAATTEEVSSPPGENEHWSQQWRRNTSCTEQKPLVDWKNVSQIRGAGRKSRKPPTPFVGTKPYGKCQFSAHEVFREGAENSARGGRAPISISEFGLKTVSFKLRAK
jgi:hypothetical protein